MLYSHSCFFLIWKGLKVYTKYFRGKNIFFCVATRVPFRLNFWTAAGSAAAGVRASSPGMRLKLRLPGSSFKVLASFPGSSFKVLASFPGSSFMVLASFPGSSFKVLASFPGMGFESVKSSLPGSLESWSLDSCGVSSCWGAGQLARYGIWENRGQVIR